MLSGCGPWVTVPLNEQGQLTGTRIQTPMWSFGCWWQNPNLNQAEKGTQKKARGTERKSEGHSTPKLLCFCRSDQELMTQPPRWVSRGGLTFTALTLSPLEPTVTSPAHVFSESSFLQIRSAFSRSPKSFCFMLSQIRSPFLDSSWGQRNVLISQVQGHTVRIRGTGRGEDESRTQTFFLVPGITDHFETRQITPGRFYSQYK